MMDPLGHLALRSNCDKAWFGWPCDAEIEKLRAEFSLATDLQKKKELAKAIQLRAVEVGPTGQRRNSISCAPCRSNVDGAPKAAIPVYWNISLK